MSIKLGIIMFLCLAPFLLIIYFLIYPKNWKKRKLIFGVRNREDFKTAEMEEKVNEIVQKRRRQAMWIIFPIILIGAALICIPNLDLMMIVYTIYIMISFAAAYFPYVRGNSELKNLKTELGIEAKGVRVADLKSISAAHALNIPMLLIPNVISAVGMVTAVLYDLKVFHVPTASGQGNFAASILTGSFFSISILFLVCARLMDNIRNEVISEESDINSNFNRAKKKIWSDAWIQMSWLNTGVLVLIFIGFLTGSPESYSITGSVVMMLGICIILGILSRKTALLNMCYKYDSSIGDDDDDNWIYGLFYYNPKDYRLNVEKRDGLGVTINLANPIGKIISILCALTVIGSIAVLFWVGIMDATDIDVRVNSGNIICHHLRDEYVIHSNEIREVSLGDNMEELRPMKIAGVATDTLLKGKFSIDGEEHVRFFMDPKVELYIRIKTDKYTYFINENSEEETQKIYDEIIN